MGACGGYLCLSSPPVSPPHAQPPLTPCLPSPTIPLTPCLHSHPAHASTRLPHSDTLRSLSGELEHTLYNVIMGEKRVDDAHGKLLQLHSLSQEGEGFRVQGLGVRAGAALAQAGG